MPEPRTDDPHVTTTRDECVAVIRLSSPPAGIVTIKGAARLADSVEAALLDPETRAVVVTGGTPGAFIRHADVGQILRGAEALAEGRISTEAFASTPYHRLGVLLDGADKPIIAAIDGVCMGGGLEIALACTMRVASPISGPIGLPEIRLDMFPGAGGFQRLARVIGPHRARLLILTGATFDGRQAAEAGLVDHLDPDPVSYAIALAKGFGRRSSDAIAAIMRLPDFAHEQKRIDEDMSRFGALVAASPEIRARLTQFLDAGEHLHLLD